MPKKIVFCADGTWNHPDQTEDGLPCPTNVYKLYKALLHSATQLPFYDDGVGADGTPIERLLGGAIGDGLFHKIKDGYTAIANAYQPGDGIYLFGFSRGAYTARSLAGMIAICGLPAPGRFTADATERAFAAYRAGAARQPLLAAVRQDFGAVDVAIDMVGVWDTVGALGIPGDTFTGLNAIAYGFLSTSLHPNVRHAYHAVSIDERRFEFPPTLWDPTDVPGQVMEQAWFPGVHGDVGGGYARSGLSDVSLGYMMARAAAAGLEFDPGTLGRYTTLDPKFALDDAHESWNVLWGFPKPRSIPADAAYADSAIQRWRGNPGYRPSNGGAHFPDGIPPDRILPVFGG